MTQNRRDFLTSSAAFAAGGILSSCSDRPKGGKPHDDDTGPRFKISLAQWSLHRALKSGELDNMDFPQFTKDNFGINAVEWVNQFFCEEDETLGYQPKNLAYLSDLKKRCDDAEVKSLLIMCDRVGNLGDPDNKKRSAAVEGHYAWLDAAKFLGCHGIRVNAASDPSLDPEQQADLCAEGLRRLAEQAQSAELNVIVENHGGLSSNGLWLAQVIKNVGLDNCGTLPDFGNFYVAKNRGDAEKWEKDKAPFADDPAYTEDETGLAYDRYKGTKELMPFAKGVSAKAHDFDEAGNEIHTDFLKMMQIVKSAGYRGYIGIEYEGSELGEVEGILKTKALLERVFEKA